MKRVLILLITVFISISAQTKQKVILDTDIGSDIDDVYALALLLASDEFEIIGITTVGLAHPERAAIIARMLWETGCEDIPIAMLGPIEDREWGNPQFLWAKGFNKVKPIKQNAADFIIEQLYKYPNEIIIFPIGPATTMASVVDKDPQALKLAKHIYAMFGSFYVGYDDNPTPTIEANVRDVESSKKFLSSGAKITLAGLEVTNIPWEAEKRHKILERQSPLTNAMSGLYSLWHNLNKRPREPILFDCVPIGMVLWPELFINRPAHVKIIGNGFTAIDEVKEPNCNIGLRIKRNEFSKRLMKRYIEQNLMR